MSVDLGVFGDPGTPPPVIVRPPRPRPRASRARRLGLVLALLLAVEGLLLAARIRVDQGTAADPRTVARQFFQALARGDAAGVRETLASPMPFAAAVLPDETAPQAARVSAVHRRGDVALVTVAYVAAGTTATSVLREHRSLSGPLHVPRWRIVGGLPRLHVNAPAYEPVAFVAGQPLALRSGGADATVFPGLLGVTVSAVLPAGATATTVYAGGAGVTATLVPMADSGVRQDVYNQATARLFPDLFPALLGSLGASQTVAVLVDSVGVEPDDRTLRFTGRILNSDGDVDPATGSVTATVGSSPLRTVTRRFSGTARYANGTTTLAAISVAPAA